MSDANAPKSFPVKSTVVPPINEFGVMHLPIQTRGAHMSLHGRSYVLANIEGESEWTMEVAGKPRKVRIKALVYIRIPPSQRFSEIAKKARERLRSRNPQIF